MGSATKSPSNSKNVSINDQSLISELNEQKIDKAKNAPLHDNKSFLEALDTPVPLVVPPHATRILKVRNCGSNEIELKLSVQNSEANDVDIHFAIKPEQTIMKSNATLSIEVSYSPIEQKFDPESLKHKKARGKSNSKIKDGNLENNIDVSNRKRHALIEIVIGDKECYYMYPLLGSSDPADETIALQKHIELSKEHVDTDEETFHEENDVNVQTTSKRKSRGKSTIQNSRSKRRKIEQDTQKSSKSFQTTTLQNIVSNIKVKEEKPDSDEDIEIKDEPIDLI